MNILLLIISSVVCSSDGIGNFAIFIIILTFVKLLTKPNEKFELTLGDKCLLVYFLVVLVSVAGSSLLFLSIKGFCKTLIYLGFYVSLIHFMKDNKNLIKYIFIIIGLLAIGECVVAIHQNFISVSEISGWQDTSRLNPEEVITRVYGTLKPYNPNLFGGYLVSVLPATLMGVFLPLKNKHFKMALLLSLFFVLCIVTIILTGCRGAYISLLAEIICLLIFSYRLMPQAYKRFFKMVALICVAISAFVLASLPAFKARIISIFAMRQDSSNSFRFNVYNSCLQMFKDNWLLGIGVGNQNFREIYGLYMRTGFDALSAYNIYLEMAVESGILALISFGTFIYFNIRKCIKYIWNNKDDKVLYLLIAVLSVIGILVHGFVDTVFFRPQIQFLFWIMIAVIRVLTTESITDGERRN
ncbi:MAG: O-antigen ligase family protein [bacterium]|nr:O-antigen ligase family protein [bacterium]